MAPLTWRNVDAPSFGSANQLWEMSANLLGRGVNSAQEGLKAYTDSTRDSQSAALMQQVLAAGGDPAAIAQAVQGANPAFLSPEALRFANAQPDVLLERQGAGLQNQIRSQSIAANDYNFERTQIENQRKDEDYALLPEALSSMANIRAGLASGDPAQVAAAEEAQKAYLPKYGRAMGINNARELGAFQSGNLDFSNAQMENANNRLQYASNLDNALQTKNVKEITNNALGFTDNDPAAALKLVQGMKDLDYETQAKVIGQISEFQKAMPAKSAADVALESARQFTGRPIDLKSTDIVGEVLASKGLPTTYKAVQYANQNGKRNLPLDPNLDQTLNSVLPKLGLTAVVASGGQSSKEEFANGTAKSRGYVGSPRHVHGNAADVKFQTVDGRTLSWENPQDVPMLQSAVRELKVAGLTGFGAARDYMGADTTHIGYGTPAVWGKKGGKPYQALMDAYSSAQSSSTGSGPTVERAAAARSMPAYQAAMDAIASGQAYNAPIDTSRVQIQNPDGTVSTEKTITTKIDDAWMNIPTIVDGKEVSEEKAIEDFKAGVNPAVGVFQSQREAEKAAESRTDEIGRMLDEAANPAATANEVQQQTNAALNEQLTPTLAQTTGQTEKRSVPVTEVDPETTAFRQDIQRMQRKGDIAEAVETLHTRVATGEGDMTGGSPMARTAGAVWDYFAATPEEAETNAAAREASQKAMDFYRTDNAKKFFTDNPEELSAAATDPVGYANNFGTTPSQKAALEVAKTLDTGTSEKKPTPFERRAPTKAETVDQLFSAARNMSALNQANQQDQPLIDAVQSRENAGKDVNQIAAILTGEGGSLKPYGQEAVTDGIRRIMEEMPGVNANIAGALLSKNGTYRDTYNPFTNGWDINYDQAREDWARYQSGAGTEGASDGIAALSASDETKRQDAALAALETRAKAEQENIQKLLADPNTTPAQRILLEFALQEILDKTSEEIEKITSTGALDINLRNNTGR